MYSLFVILIPKAQKILSVFPLVLVKDFTSGINAYGVFWAGVRGLRLGIPDVSPAIQHFRSNN